MNAPADPRRRNWTKCSASRPQAENNDPEPYEAPLYEEEPFPDFEAEIEREMDEDEEDTTIRSPLRAVR